MPELFVRDVIWIVSGKGQPWKEVEELAINDVWDTFPADVVPVEPGLPYEAPKSSTPTRMPSPFRRRRRATGTRGSGPTTTSRQNRDATTQETDLGRIPLQSLVNYTDYNDQLS